MKVGKILYDHWLQVFNTLVSLPMVAVVFMTIPLSPLFDVFSQPIAGWIALLLFIIIEGIIKKMKAPIAFFPEPGMRPPVHKIRDLKKFAELHEVLWNLWEGYDYLSKDNDKRRLWVDGPFCPLCKYELDRENGKWMCVECRKSFKIPREIRENTIRKVIKIFEAEIRRYEE